MKNPSRIYSLRNIIRVLKVHGLAYALRYIFNYSWQSFLFLINSLWALPFVLMSRILKPVLLIKFGICRADRIGHFIEDSLEEIIGIQKSSKKYITFWGTTRISNYQWLKMLKKEIFISTKYNYLFYWNKLLPGSNKHIDIMARNGSRDIEGKFYKDKVKLEMSSKDVMESNQWLKSLGWRGEPFICLLARDSAYLSQSDIYNGSIVGKKEQFSYHSYRDSDIETYRLAVEYLLEKGYWVFRMGSITEKELKIDHRNFFDYSYSSAKCDLLDIYLFSNCAGCISTSTGMDILPQVYSIPTLIVNGSPLGFASTFSNIIWVPKNLFWSNNHQSLSLKEHIENSFLFTDKYSEAGIKIIDLGPQEILEVLKR